MKVRSLLVALVGVGLVAASTSPPGGTHVFYQATPPNPRLIRMVGRSHISLITDLFWVRAVGVSINLKVPADGLALVSWCELVTQLDPQFVWPYIFGGLLGPVPLADLRYTNVTEANALLQRGVEEIPNDFRLPLYLSFNQLHLAGDPAAAAETLRKGARNPRAPLYMAQLATRLLAQTDAFEAARTFASELEQSSQDPEVRAFFERRRLEIERDERLATLQRAVDTFRAARGQLPQTLVQLLSEGFLTELPSDPLGGDFRLGADGVVTSASGERLKAFIQKGVP